MNIERIIFTILFAVSSAFVLIDVLQLPAKFPKLKRKPFNCSTCMSGWLTLFFLFVPYAYVVGIMSLSMLASIVIIGLIKKHL